MHRPSHFDFLVFLASPVVGKPTNIPQPHPRMDKMEGSAELFPLQLQILDPRGILLREIQVQQETWINVSQLSPGLYYLRLSAGHRQKVEKLIKQ
jgi:hypothetical protein